MNLSAMFSPRVDWRRVLRNPKQTLTAADLPPGRISYDQITGVRVCTSQDVADAAAPDRLMLRLHRFGLEVSLPGASAAILRAAWGEDVHKWTGKRVGLFRSTVESGQFAGNLTLRAIPGDIRTSGAAAPDDTADDGDTNGR